MKTRSLLAIAAACTLVVGCDGLKEAFSAHTDVVARAGSQQLSVQRLGNLLGHATLQVPPSRDVADILAEFWVDYQLLGEAAAKGDSLTNKAEIDEATRGYTTTLILRKMQTVVDSMLVKDKPTEAGYNQGVDDIYAARHILFQFPPNATPAQKDSVHRRAQSVLPQVNTRNFATMARKYSADNTAAQGGDLGIFTKQQMVPEFGNAVAALKPGQISSLVATQYGYHIIQRLPYSQVKDRYEKQFEQLAARSAERNYMDKLQAGANIVVKPGATGVAKVAALDEAGHRKDNGVLATFKDGTLTVRRFLMWLDTYPPGQRITQQIQSAPDSILNGLIKGIATNEVLVQKADSMHITLTPQEKAGVYQQFGQAVTLSWNSLGVDPKALADSAKTPAARERLAAARVETLMDNIMSGKLQPVPVPTPLKVLLETKYSWKINQAGLDRATQLAKQIRTSADSAKAANEPKSVVPLPGATPPAGTTGTKKP